MRELKTFLRNPEMRRDELGNIFRKKKKWFAALKLIQDN